MALAVGIPSLDIWLGRMWYLPSRGTWRTSRRLKRSRSSRAVARAAPSLGWPRKRARPVSLSTVLVCGLAVSWGGGARLRKGRGGAGAGGDGADGVREHVPDVEEGLVGAAGGGQLRHEGGQQAEAVEAEEMAPGPGEGEKAEELLAVALAGHRGDEGGVPPHEVGGGGFDIEIQLGG